MRRSCLCERFPGAFPSRLVVTIWDPWTRGHLSLTFPCYDIVPLVFPSLKPRSSIPNSRARRKAWHPGSQVHGLNSSMDGSDQMKGFPGTHRIEYVPLHISHGDSRHNLSLFLQDTPFMFGKLYNRHTMSIPRSAQGARGIVEFIISMSTFITKFPNIKKKTTGPGIVRHHFISLISIDHS
jgi:hypothetical protein